MDSSPGFWAAFGEVLAREYSDVNYGANHHLTVDAYALQHPGKQSPQSINSIAVHLVSLYLIFERDMTMSAATRSMQKLVEHKAVFSWLDPSADLGQVTVRGVLNAKDAEAHVQMVKKWAESTWSAWEEYRDQVKEWAELCG
ncbi:MAG: hypothetical protein IIA98_10730 [Proteobacteria bacterium]|nr:hypothetical protein [Pseudomonadota bacterium]